MAIIPKPKSLPGPKAQGAGGCPLDPGQQLLTDLTERIEKELQVRNDLINQIPATGATGKKVRALLHCLVGFAHTRLGGEWHITVPLDELADRLVKDHRTINAWVRLAYPHVEEIPSNHTAKTFVIHWLALVNREPLRERPEPIDPQQRQAGSTAAESETRQAGSTADQNRGGQNSMARGAKLEIEGVKNEVGGGQNSSDLPPSALLKTGRPVLQRSISKEPVKPVGNLAPLPEDLPRDTPAKWRMAIATRDLKLVEDVEELYGIAVALGIVRHAQVDRQRIYTQACVDNRLMRQSLYYVRHGQKVKRTPGAVFRENTLHRRWDWRQDGDVDEAMAMIARADAMDPAKMVGTREEKIAAVERERARRKAAGITH